MFISHEDLRASSGAYRIPYVVGLIAVSIHSLYFLVIAL